jgi:flagellar biogenesis protein FliO
VRAIAIALVIALSGAIAHGQTEPAPSFEILDRGDAVEVIAHHIKAARTAILPLRQRLQVPIVGAPSAKRIMPTDPTVKLVELDSEDTTRVLSVKLSFERPDVKTLSRYAQAIQVGDDLHVIVPRKLPTDGVAPKLPEPTLSPAAAAAVARADLKPPIALGPTPPNPPAPAPAPSKPSVIPSIAPQLGPIAPVAPPTPAKPTEAKPPEATRPTKPVINEPVPGPLKVEVEKPAPAKPPEAVKEAAKPEPIKPADEPREKAFGPQPDPLVHITKPAAAEHKPEPAAGATKPAAKPGDDKSLSQTLAPASETTWGSAILYLVLGAAALAAGVWHLRRKRGQGPQMASIEILAQRSLGGRARLVWLTAGPHEMLVAVTGQQINLLGQWPRDRAANIPANATFAEAMSASLPASLPAEPAPSRFGFGPASAYAAAARQDPKPAKASKTTSQPLPPLPPLRAKRPSMARDAAVDVDVEHEPPARQVSRPLPIVKPVAAVVEEPPARPSRPAIVLPPAPAAEPARPRRPSVRAKTHIEAPPSRPPPAVVSDDRDGELDAMLSSVSTKPAEPSLSPAVDGILRLRGQNSQGPTGKPAIIDVEAEETEETEEAEEAEAPAMTAEDEHAGGPPDDDDDADADPEANQDWIKQILAATGGK